MHIQHRPARLHHRGRAAGTLQDFLANGQLTAAGRTHALARRPGAVRRLGPLVVVDERTASGVRQRNPPACKGLQPNLLTMTATPIPRTLALSAACDWRWSQIERTAPRSHARCVPTAREVKRQQAYQLIRQRWPCGLRAMWSLPPGEESKPWNLCAQRWRFTTAQRRGARRPAFGRCIGRNGQPRQGRPGSPPRLAAPADVLVSTTVVKWA